MLRSSNPLAGSREKLAAHPRQNEEITGPQLEGADRAFLEVNESILVVSDQENLTTRLRNKRGLRK